MHTTLSPRRSFVASIFACSLLAAALVLGGCGGDSSQERGGVEGDILRGARIGFAQTGAESVWRTAHTRSIREEAEKRGVDLRFSSAEGDQANQIRAVRSFIAQGVDLIMVAPLVETGWDPVLREAKRAGIPVVLLDRRVDTSDESLYETFIGSDFVEEGRLAARWMIDNVEGDSVSIVEMQGTPGSAPAIDRGQGFREVIADNPRFRVIESQSANFRRSDGKDLMESLLKKHRDIDVLYAHNDDMAFGAIQAIEAAGLKPGTDIVIISVDAIKEAFQMILAGKMNCTVECSPLLGPLAFDTAAQILAGEEVPKRTVMEDRVFDASNAADYIDERQY